MHFEAVGNLYLFCLKMIVDLTKLEAAPISFDLPIKPSEIDLESDLSNTNGEVRFNGRLTGHTHWLTIDGEISGEVDVACGRCLGAVNQELDISFETAFVRTDDYTEELETELDIKALEVSIFEGDKIDLIEVAQEQILLFLPSQVYCEKDCKGLCPKCGANRNLIDCKCEETKVDSRWSALSKLKDDE